MISDTIWIPANGETTRRNSADPAYTSLVYQDDKRPSRHGWKAVISADASNNQTLSAWMGVDDNFIVKLECSR